MLGSAAQAGAAGCGAWPPSAPAACARLSLCPTAGKLPPRRFKNKHMGLLGGLPCKNKYGISASPPGAGAHALFGGTSSPTWPPPHESPHAGSSEAGWVPNPPADPSPSNIFCWFTGRKQSLQTKQQQGQQLTPSQGVGNQLSHAPDLQKLTAVPCYPPKPPFFFPLGRNKPSLQQAPCSPRAESPVAAAGPWSSGDPCRPLRAMGASPRSCAQQAAVTPCCRACCGH